jgi:hypothetical protein
MSTKTRPGPSVSKGEVVNIYAAFGEIGCIQVALAANESAGQACVSGTVGGLDEGDSMRRGRCRPLS